MLLFLGLVEVGFLPHFSSKVWMV